MTKQKSTKRALLMSGLALLMCVSMLVGSTFAWFTDSVTSGSNVIQSGTLDIVMEYWNGTEWADAEGVKLDFKKASTGAGTEVLWEPGCTYELPAIRVRNEGNLSAKILIKFNGITGDEKLMEAIEFKTKVTNIPESLLTGSQKDTYVKLNNQELDVFYNTPDGTVLMDWSLAPKGETTPNSGHTDTTAEFTIFGHMDENAGNEYQGLSIENVSILVVATQQVYEYDSFGRDYDKDAKYPVIVTADTIKDAFKLSDGTDITKNISSIIFGKPADYPEITSNYTGTVDGDVTVYQVLNSDTTTYTIYYLSDGKIGLPANSKSLFQDMSNLTEFDTSNLDMSTVNNALGMFANCAKLETLDTADWDTSNITNMQSLFYGCNNLENIDVSNWDTSNVTNMRMVFFRCYELSNDVLKGVENWDVSNVTNFYSMFKHARGLTSLDLSNWDTSSAITMSHMFANIGGVEELDLSGFDTSKVTDMSWMFYDASKLTTIYVGDGWTTEAVTTTTQPFYNNQALVGGAGTTWLDVCDMANAARPWESSAKLDFAIVDDGTTNPGLLTYKAN